MSKVIFKLSYKHPNFKDTASKNVAHVTYIATRPGTDKTLTEADLKAELDKGINQILNNEEEKGVPEELNNGVNFSEMSQKEIQDYLSSNDIIVYHATTKKESLLTEGYDSEKGIGLRLTKGEKSGTVFGTFDIRYAQSYAKTYEQLSVEGADIGIVGIKVKAGTAIVEGNEIRFNQKDILEISDIRNKSDDEIHLKYLNERPGSHGLFGKDGPENLKAVQEEIRNHKGFVWRGIVSLKEGDAKELDYMNKEKWQDLLRKKIPDMAAEMGIRIDNLRWVSAVHMEKGHPHTHLMVWEKTPEMAMGVISGKSLDNIRKLFTDEIFEEERFNLLQEKQTMRDLIRDLANNDIGQASRLLKEIKEAGVEVKSLISEANTVGTAPRLYSDDEFILADKIKRLASMMPEKGRISLKLMPEDIKTEARTIAEYLLSRHEFSASLERNLKAVEELTKMYTGKDEAINEARERAYNDIRDRVSQVVLRGAAESRKKNYLKVNQELADMAVDVIKNLSNQIDLHPERMKVFTKIGISLIRTGHTDEQIGKFLFDYSVSQNFNYSKDSLPVFIKELRTNGYFAQEIDSLGTSTKFDLYLASLKLSGYNEKEAFNHITKAIEIESRGVKTELERLKKIGLMKEIGGIYKLTEEGIGEFLKLKKLDPAQNNIMRSLNEKDMQDYSNLIESKDIFNSLSDKDPEEFKLTNYDKKIREAFGEENNITERQIEELVFNKYTRAYVTDAERAEKEIEAYKHRIYKLCINGYVKFDKETGKYSFTEEAEKDLAQIKDQMEFSRYDANVTLEYIEKAQEGLLKAEDLEKQLHTEIINQTAKDYFDTFTEIIDSGKGKEFLSVDENGSITATEEGRKLSFQLSEINRFFTKAHGSLTEEKLKTICTEDYKEVKEQLDALVKQGLANHSNGAFSLTAKGVDEFLKLKGLDSVQQDILEVINNGEASKYEDVLKSESIAKNLYDKDPEEFKVKKFDLKIQEEFGEENRLSLGELENRIKERYSQESPEEVEKAQTEYNITKGRIENLTLNGYVDYDENTDTYSFTEEGMQELKSLPHKMEFGPYDAKVTLSYIDRAEGGILKIDDLKSSLYKEVINQTAKKYYESFKDLLDNDKCGGFIKVDDEGRITATKEGKNLSFELRKIDKYFFKAKGSLTEEKLNKICHKEFGAEECEKETKRILEEIKGQVQKGNVIQDSDGSFRIDPIKADVCRLSYQIYKAGGGIQRDSLKDVLEKNIPNHEAKKRFEYLEKRLNFLKKEGYVTGAEGEFKITAFGEEQRKDLLNPERVYLRKELKYLEKLGFLIKSGEGYETTAKYQDHIKNLENEKGTKEVKSSYHMNKYMANLFQKTLDNVNLKTFEPTEKHIRRIMNRIKVQVKRENVLSHTDGSYSIEPLKKDIRNFLHQIHKEKGCIQKDSLKQTLEKNVPNIDAERQYKYLIKRMEFLKKEGYLSGNEGEYQITQKGIDKRNDIKDPQRVYLKKELNYLQRLGLIKETEEGYSPTEKYKAYVEEQNKESNNIPTKKSIGEFISKMIDRTYGEIDLGKMDRNAHKMAQGKHINGQYNEAKTDYSSMRDICKVPDLQQKAIGNMSKILLVSGVSLEETKNIINEWNVKSGSNIDPEKLKKIIDDVNKNVQNDSTWGRTTIIGKEEWKETFNAFGIKEPPEWMYKGNFHGGMGLASIINTVWKSAWMQLERQRMQTEAEVQSMKNKLLKDQNLSKEAIREQIRESKSSPFREHDYEQ